MRLDEKGVNEHGVAMCECGNKPAHAWEPGESCGDRVIPKAAGEPDAPENPPLLERLRFIGYTMERQMQEGIAVIPSDEVDSTLKMVADFREAADQLEAAEELLSLILEETEVPINTDVGRAAGELRGRIAASNPMPIGMTMEFVRDAEAAREANG